MRMGMLELDVWDNPGTRSFRTGGTPCLRIESTDTDALIVAVNEEFLAVNAPTVWYVGKWRIEVSEAEESPGHE